MRHFLSFTLILSLIPFSFSASADLPQTPLNSPEFEIGDTSSYLQVNNMPSLADLLTIESSASIFYSYARELALSQLFADSKSSVWDGDQKLTLANGGLTLLVPTNKAVMALARKPHQGPPPKNENEGITISDEEFHKLSKENVQRWVEAHIIASSPLTFPAPTVTYETVLQGKFVSFTSTQSNGDDEDWKTVTIEDGIKILSMKQASNGVLYIIDGTIDVE
ncbi:uncharacterized protein C8R40DRAFT_1166775 [Lentinula edodes]|uniref:uncharacterized protein n=1 Tax=Lentinula edodes TaxID=5353 RepID=UPI001BFB49B2|nr:uncharacterized protein C8R40DRAFT_1166775 [Lentinula edodes]KAF8826224.1 hypothetical protein HHX47_DHR6000388 [Lentinula edodes]KAH7878789.1 hypothetical protein C8R40DRAFT_1166775 [Lentinula edodes]